MMAPSTSQSTENFAYLPPRSLDEYQYQSALSFSKPTQLQPFKLSSLTAPFVVDRKATLLFVGSSICVALILMIATGKCNTSEALLSVFSGTIGKSLPPGGISRYSVGYIVWLLLISFISTDYTNILQSIVVVPKLHHSDRTFEQMLQENFTFEAIESRWIRLYSSEMGCTFSGEAETKRKCSLLEREVQLASRVTDFEAPIAMTLTWYISRFSEGHKKVCVVRKLLLERLRGVPTIIGLDAVVGKERFFNAPCWWDFRGAERGSYLAQSVEILKQFGLISYFVDLYESKFQKELTSEVYMEMTAADEAFGPHQASDSDVSVPLMDSLVSESFALFLYGVFISVVGFVCEMITSHFKGLALAFFA